MDSIGGTITCVIRNVPAGLGEPVFDKFEAKLAHAMLSIPATKGFEIGSGFRGTEVPGSKHNDPFIGLPDGRLGTATNWSGGVQGGISNAEDVYFRCAVLLPVFVFFLFMLHVGALESVLRAQRQSHRRKPQPSMMVPLANSRHGADMTPALFRVLFPSSRRWPALL
jgi:Chorismate synthase